MKQHWMSIFRHQFDKFIYYEGISETISIIQPVVAGDLCSFLSRFPFIEILGGEEKPNLST
jgi:hypothetical protein